MTTVLVVCSKTIEVFAESQSKEVFRILSPRENFTNMASIFMLKSQDVGKTKEIADFNWEKYTAGRPIYPQSLWDRVLNYHSKHSGSWEKVNDVGAGAAVYTKKLGEKFSHVAVTEPNEEFMSLAKKRLSAESDSDQKYQFHQASFDDQIQPENSVDMVFASECMHWSTNASKSISEFHRQLKPGGTFVEIFYLTPLLVTTEIDPSGQQPDTETFKGNQRLNEIWQRFWDIKGEFLLANGALEATSHVWPDLQSAFKTHDLSSFEKAQRVFLNIEPGAESAPKYFGVKETSPLSIPWTSVANAEKEEFVYTQCDEGWYFDFDMKFLNESYDSWPWPIRNEEVSQLLDEADKILGGGSRRAFWYVILNMASKPMNK